MTLDVRGDASPFVEPSQQPWSWKNILRDEFPDKMPQFQYPIPRQDPDQLFRSVRAAIYCSLTDPAAIAWHAGHSDEIVVMETLKALEQGQLPEYFPLPSNDREGMNMRARVDTEATELVKEFTQKKRATKKFERWHRDAVDATISIVTNPSTHEIILTCPVERIGIQIGTPATLLQRSKVRNNTQLDTLTKLKSFIQGPDLFTNNEKKTGIGEVEALFTLFERLGWDPDQIRRKMQQQIVIGKLNEIPSDPDIRRDRDTFLSHISGAVARYHLPFPLDNPDKQRSIFEIFGDLIKQNDAYVPPFVEVLQQIPGVTCPPGKLIHKVSLTQSQQIHAGRANGLLKISAQIGDAFLWKAPEGLQLDLIHSPFYSASAMLTPIIQTGVPQPDYVQLRLDAMRLCNDFGLTQIES